MGVPLFGQEHVDRYRETDGGEGHDWQGTTVLLLTTTGSERHGKRSVSPARASSGRRFCSCARATVQVRRYLALALDDEQVRRARLLLPHETSRPLALDRGALAIELDENQHPDAGSDRDGVVASRVRM